MVGTNSTSFSCIYFNKAHEEAEDDHFLGTDDASLLERIGEQVVIIEGNYDNIKITTQEDLYFAEAILKKKANVKEDRGEDDVSNWTRI